MQNELNTMRKTYENKIRSKEREIDDLKDGTQILYDQIETIEVAGERRAQDRLTRMQEELDRSRIEMEQMMDNNKELMKSKEQLIIEAKEARHGLEQER